MKRARARGRVISLGLATAFAVTALACEPAAPSSAPPSPSPTVTRTPTPAPSRTPPPGAAELPASRDGLQPGRYTRRGFVPTITFEVGRSWRAVQLRGGFFDIQRDEGSPHVVAVQFARPDGIYAAGGRLVAPSTADAAVDALGRNASVTIVESSESLMDGLSGSQVTIETNAGAGGDAAVLHVPPGPLPVSPGRRLWIAFFDTPEGLLAIMVDGSVARWEQALLAAEPVLESVTIGR